MKPLFQLIETRSEDVYSINICLNDALGIFSEGWCLEQLQANAKYYCGETGEPIQGTLTAEERELIRDLYTQKVMAIGYESEDYDFQGECYRDDRRDS
jgi:hypothetical protein